MLLGQVDTRVPRRYWHLGRRVATATDQLGQGAWRTQIGPAAGRYTHHAQPALRAAQDVTRKIDSRKCGEEPFCLDRVVASGLVGAHDPVDPHELPQEQAHQGVGHGAGERAREVRLLPPHDPATTRVHRDDVEPGVAVRDLGRHADAFAQRGMRMDRLADVDLVGAHLDGQRDLADHVAGVRADDAAAQDLAVAPASMAVS